jgi:hypothetical protein
MNFSSLNLNLNRNKIEKEFLFDSGQGVESGHAAHVRSGLAAWPEQLAQPKSGWAGPRGATPCYVERMRRSLGCGDSLQSTLHGTVTGE